MCIRYIYMWVCAGVKLCVQACKSAGMLRSCSPRTTCAHLNELTCTKCVQSSDNLIHFNNCITVWCIMCDSYGNDKMEHYKNQNFQDQYAVRTHTYTHTHTHTHCMCIPTVTMSDILIGTIQLNENKSRWLQQTVTDHGTRRTMISSHSKQNDPQQLWTRIVGFKRNWT